MTKDEIIKTLRDMAKYPTVTLPRDCEALRIAADLLAQPEQEPVCDKDPQGCWSVRCQLGKKCKNTSPPCPTCKALARTVMMDQTGRDA